MKLKDLFKRSNTSASEQGQPSAAATLAQQMENKVKTEERVLEMLKTVYDPEIPVNIYDLGLIYRIDLQDNGTLEVDMTMTAPNCPAADFIVEDVRQKLNSVENVNEVVINLVFEPEWTKDMMSDEAKLELNML